MEEIWKLYDLASEITDKKCKIKCFSYGSNKIDACYDYVTKRLLKNNLKDLKTYDPSKGAQSTFLYTIIDRKIIDFLNSAKETREIADDDSISNRPNKEVEHNDYRKILDKVVLKLTSEEKTYLKLAHEDEIGYKEIGNIFDITAKQASKKVENIQKKLKRWFKKLGLNFKDII